MRFSRILLLFGKILNTPPPLNRGVKKWTKNENEKKK
jgi:hypothetical protein